MAEGQLQREGEVIHVVVRRCHNVSKLLRQLTVPESGEQNRPQLDNVVQGKIFPEGRNFK